MIRASYPLVPKGKATTNRGFVWGVVPTDLGLDRDLDLDLGLDRDLDTDRDPDRDLDRDLDRDRR